MGTRISTNQPTRIATESTCTVGTTPSDSNNSLTPRKPNKVLSQLGPFKLLSCDFHKTIEFELTDNHSFSVKFLDKDEPKRLGKRSPSSVLNISEGTKDQMKVPASAHSFFWAYPSTVPVPSDPIPTSTETTPQTEQTAEEKLCLYGGFVYLDVNGKIVGIYAVDNTPGKDLEFIGPYLFDDAVKTIQLEKDGRIHSVSLPVLVEKGITHFCWLLPNETRTNGSVLCTNGAFLYLHASATFYFKVKDTSKPVWEWEYKDIWQAYDCSSSQRLEDAYSTGKEQINLTIDHSQFSIDFIHMKQLNLKSGAQRCIRRTFWADTQASSKWECYVKKRWQPYKNDENAVLDAAFFSSALSGSTQECWTITLCRFIDNKLVNYEIDFARLKQKNLTTSFERPIRRACTSKIQNQRIPWAKRTKVKAEDRNLAPEHKQPCYGTIGITVKGARNIATSASSSPCVVITTDFSSFTWSSSLKHSDSLFPLEIPSLGILKSTTEIVWNEDCAIDVARGNSSGNILLTIYDYSDKDPNQRIYLGRVALGLSEIVRLQNAQFWKGLDFESEKKNSTLPPGEIELTVVYNPREIPQVSPPLPLPSPSPSLPAVLDKPLPRPSLQSIWSNPNVLNHLTPFEQKKLKELTPKPLGRSSPHLNIPEVKVSPPTEGLAKAEVSAQQPIVSDYVVIAYPSPLKEEEKPPSLYDDVDLSAYKDMEIVEGEIGLYVLGKKLGSGAFGIVKRATNIKTKQTVAVKIIGIDDCNEREIQIMRVVKNQYCVSFIDCLETEESFYIVMEFCSQGDLFDAIEADILDEPRVQKAVLDTLKGLQYLHRSGICHRDIKPENILHYVHLDEKTGQIFDNWKIADFGIATFFTEGRIITGSTGTTQYKAPEMFPPARYTKAVDLWAVGITMYVCLTGRFVWAGESDDEVLQSIHAYRIEYENEFSSNAFSIILRLLDLNPETRMTIEEAQTHPWLAKVK